MGIRVVPSLRFIVTDTPCAFRTLEVCIEFDKSISRLHPFTWNSW